MMTKRFYIETYGCEMNKSDSIDIALSFLEKGFQWVNTGEEADVVIINTCAVRENAEQRIEGRLGYYRNLIKRSGRKVVIVIAGCMAQEKGEEFFKLFPEIKLVTGTYHICDIPFEVENLDNNRKHVLKVDQTCYSFPRFRGRRAQGYRAWVNIIKGCSNFCSYCIVPYLRGPEVSKKSDEVIKEIEELAERGVREVTLLGQNVNAYGRDSGDISFVELLERINKIEGIKWIRFLTSHPKDFTEKAIKEIASMEKVCKHFHLPIQSGSDRVLALMNRGYTRNHYLKIVKTIREQVPQSSITTDLLVGFPGEKEEDFKQTLNIVEEVGFDEAFTYRYSKRPFTRAVQFYEQVNNTEAQRRLDTLIRLQRELSLKRKREEIGRNLKVLVERESKKNKEEYLCRTETNKMVVVKTEKQPGSFIDVRITGISGNTLRGEEIEV